MTKSASDHMSVASEAMTAAIKRMVDNWGGLFDQRLADLESGRLTPQLASILRGQIEYVISGNLSDHHLGTPGEPAVNPVIKAVVDLQAHVFDLGSRLMATIDRIAKLELIGPPPGFGLDGYEKRSYAVLCSKRHHRIFDKTQAAPHLEYGWEA